MGKTEVLENIEGLGEVHRIYAPFLKQLRDFRADGINAPVSVRDASYIRLHGNNKEYTNKEYTRTCHAPICAKDSDVIVARMSPLIRNLKMVEQVVQAHQNNQYPILDNNNSIYAQWEKIAKQDKKRLKPEKRGAIILPQRGDYSIHKDSAEAKFFFQDMRELYFNQVVKGDSVPIWQIPVDAVDSANGTVVNFVGFCSPGCESGLGFGDGLLYGSGRALGVLRKSAEGTSRKVSGSLPYTQRGLNRTIKVLEGIKQGKVRVSDLGTEVGKVAEFLQRLKR